MKKLAIALLILFGLSAGSAYALDGWGENWDWHTHSLFSDHHDSSSPHSEHNRHGDCC
ncbi:hypothetical protein [Vibrio hepatarius]|uniref:hypothetical protein n=1 Tax=Vibrio hepatarius TaxID=171383 RepID=UPI00373679D4